MGNKIYAGIDAGGTEFKCIAGSSPNDVVACESIPVTTPLETLTSCLSFFRRIHEACGGFAGLGIASFGPLDLRKKSSTYGCITSTPKVGWSNTNILAFFSDAFRLPVAFDTDVNGALLGEMEWGAAQNLHSAVYVTIGTGVGAGVMMDGRLIYGSMHTEMGHMLLRKQANDDFSGVCPFHGTCLEGLASGPAIQQRWRQDPRSLVGAHPAWELQAHYLASMCVNLALAYSPQRIILGGGVMQQKSLFSLIRQSYFEQMNHYLGDQGGIEQFIVEAGLGGRAGALGSLVLAKKVVEET